MRGVSNVAWPCKPSWCTKHTQKECLFNGTKALSYQWFEIGIHLVRATDLWVRLKSNSHWQYSNLNFLDQHDELKFINEKITSATSHSVNRDLTVFQVELIWNFGHRLSDQTCRTICSISCWQYFHNIQWFLCLWKASFKIVRSACAHDSSAIFSSLLLVGLAAESLYSVANHNFSCFVILLVGLQWLSTSCERTKDKNCYCRHVSTAANQCQPDCYTMHNSRWRHFLIVCARSYLFLNVYYIIISVQKIAIVINFINFF